MASHSHILAILATRPTPALTLDAMRRDVAAAIGVSPAVVGDHDDLIGLGLDSLGVMKLATLWTHRGVGVTFAELISHQTLHEWWQLASTCAAVESLSTPSVDIDQSAPFDLAPMQQAYWLGRRDDQVLGVGCHFYFEFDGHDVDPDRLETAVHRLFDRHDMLRARFLENGRQQVSPHSTWRGLRVHDLRTCTPEEAAHALERIRDTESHRKMDVERGDGFDVQLTRVRGHATRVHINIDMLVADAQSFRILVDELAQLYALPAVTLPPINYSYPRYLADRRTRNQDARESARTYWQSELARLPNAPQLPLAIDPERLPHARTGRRARWFAPADVDCLRTRARQHGLTVPMTLAAVFAEVLCAWSAEPAFVINLPLFDRDPLHPDVHRLVGDFTGSVLLALDLTGQLPFAERARQIQARFRDHAAHSAYSGVDVLRDLSRAQPGEASSRAGVVFTSALGMGDLFGPEAPRQFGTLAWMISQTAQVWLDCQVTELDAGLLINWDAVEPLFAPGVLDAMFAAQQTILTRLLDPSSDWNDPVPDLLPEPQRLTRAAVNRTERVMSGRLLHEGFFARAAEDPHRLALAWGDDGRMTYGELAESAKRTAARLVARGLKPGERVAITMPKGPRQAEAALAILCAGGVYVPSGVEQPLHRRAHVYLKAGVRFVLTSAAERNGIEWPDGVDVLTLDEAESIEPLAAPIAVPASSLAYVLFTSGSTGDPKGVMMSHRGAMNTIDDLNERFAVCEADRSFAVSALDFDLSVFDMFGLLSVGGAVVFVDESGRRDAWRWAALVRRWNVSIWQSVPALLDMLLLVATPDDLKSVRIGMLGGDWVGLDQGSRLRAVAPQCRLFALGGTTETAIHSTVVEVGEVPEQWRSIPYGVPLGNVRCRVVDGRGRDCPDWVPGELWIGGAGVSEGYLGDPERTARQFVEHDGVRWYRAGDVARYWSDGTLEFLGRADSQVKVRGHRIELGEIEAALEAHPRVARAVAVTVQAPALQLAAAVVATDSAPELAALLSFLRARLPAYMLPERIVVLDRFPLSATQKIDRKAIRRLLAEHSSAAACEPGDLPLTDIERAVAGIWTDMLTVAVVTRDDSFFALGGDSLLATRLVSRLRAAGIRHADLRQLFARPRLRDFAATLEYDASAAELPALQPDPAHRHDPFPPTEVQRAYWIGRRQDFTLGGVGAQWYWEFDGEDVDLARLEAAWNALIARHDMLRAVFDADGQQQVLPEVPHVSIPAMVAIGDPTPALDQLRASLASRVADPESWPLCEFGAVRYGNNRTRVGVSFDCIVLDALSIMIVFDELATLYEHPAAELPATSLTFRDCVLGRRRDPHSIQAARDYWDGVLPELPPAPQLPLVKDASLVVGGRFTRREARIGRQRWQALVARAREHNLTPSTILAAAFTEVLSAWSGRQDMTLVFTLFDRENLHADVNRVVGDFTSLLLVPHRPPSSATWLETARALQESVWASLQHRAISALDLLRDLARLSSTPVAPIPVVFTSTLGVADDLVNLSFPFGAYAGGLSQTPQVYLDNQVVAHDGELLINWDSVDELFPDGMLDAMFAAYVRLLDGLSAPERDWQQPVPPLIPAAQLAVRTRVNATAAPEHPRTLHHAFFARAVAMPDRPAVVGPDARLSYGELADRALRVAQWLREHDVGPGDLVAVNLPKGVNQIAAVLGVLAAGAAYVPVGIDQPAVRRQRIYDNSQPRLVLDDPTGAFERPPLPAPLEADAASLAYVIYTSGSTGEPKGVEMTHRAAANTVDDINERFGVGANDRVLGVSALDFDLSVYDIFGLLSCGGTIVLVEEESRRDAFYWAEIVRSERITIWNSVPALLDMLLTAAGEKGLGSSLRLAMVSGDWVGLDLRARLKTEAPACRLVALGGATEAAIWSNAFEVDSVPPEWRSIPYGFPLRNQQFRTVDARGLDCPDWVPGELWIGGAGVARGYRNAPTETAQRFVERNDTRWYRTGDRGRYWPDGTLEFLGRVDFQVKVRGHRIELGEIEAAMNRHPAVARSVAFMNDRRALAAAVVTRAGETLDRRDMAGFLTQHLPASMIPELFVAVPSLPLTANGKVDRDVLTRLALADVAGSDDSADPPKGPIEEAVAEVWIELLRVPRVGRSQSFFALGGDSLLATVLIETLRKRMGILISLRELFANATVAQLAAAIEPIVGPGFETADEGVV